MVEAMQGYVNAGFRAVKMKIGALSPAADAERVEAVREALGSECRLMVDANSAYTVKGAIQMAERLEDVALEWFEEPVWADDVAGSAQVAATIEVPVSGYETEFGLYGFRELVTRRAVDVVQPDITWTGGFTESIRIAALAAAYDMPCSPHCFSSAITMVASLHLAAAIPNAGWLEFDRMPNGLREELLTQPLAVDGEGFVAVPNGPGLGVELDEKVVAKYRVDTVGEQARKPSRRRAAVK
jgi:L-alanine-DL-glutamate epimerase-like enolase superfamily enzyme